MPVDKFGHTDSTSVQRVVASGVTLTQINNSFVRLDGSNAFVPSEDNHITTKKYVDDQDAMKLSKTGDTVSGDLFISASSDPAVDRNLGCNNILERQRFTLLLGNTGNKISFHNTIKKTPVVIQTANGLRVRINDEVAIDIVKDGRDTVSRINVFKPIYMNGAGITGLAEPTGDGSAVTKKYVDNSWKKCLVGYIPNLEANNSITGFFATASSNSRGHEAYRAFNNLTSGDSWFSGVDGSSAWLQIRCPEPVIIWRLALKVRMNLPGWDLTGSNDGITFTAPLASKAVRLTGSAPAMPVGSAPGLSVGSAPAFFNISTTTAYQYYKLTLQEEDWLLQGIEVMQLYVYDT